MEVGFLHHAYKYKLHYATLKMDERAVFSSVRFIYLRTVDWCMRELQ